MRVFKHPEQMTPGSFWKVKGMKGLRYLEGDYKIGCNFRKWHRKSIYCSKTCMFIQEPMPELDFVLDELYLLVKFERSKEGWIQARFLSPKKVVIVDMHEEYWDKSFRLAKRTNSPKKVERLIFDKYDIVELKKKLGLE